MKRPGKMSNHIDNFFDGFEKMRKAIALIELMSESFATVDMMGPAERLSVTAADLRAAQASMREAYQASLSDRMTAVVTQSP